MSGWSFIPTVWAHLLDDFRDEIVAGRADVMVTDGIEVEQQSLLHPELCATLVPAPFTRLEKA